jgi:hypothetical protein
MLDNSILSDERMMTEMLSYLSKPENENHEEVSIINSMMANLIEFMNAIGLKKTMSILHLYTTGKGTTYD